MSLFGTIGSAVGSFFGEIGSAIGGAAGSLLDGGINSAIDYRYDIKQMREQAALEYEYKQKVAENQPSWNVEGLKKAGLNPILAAGGLGGSSASSVNVAPVNAKRGSQAVNNALALAQIEKAGAEIDATQQLANQYSSSARQMQEQTKLIAEQIEALRRDNKVQRDHPDVPIVKAYQNAWPHIGGLVGAVRAIGEYFSENSAKSSKTKPRQLFEFRGDY